MPDITMCSSSHCPERNNCYRAMAKPNKYAQSYTNFEYTCNEDSGFNEFIKMNLKEKRK